MSKELITELENILNTVAAGFPKVAGKKMFGCHALWANGAVFALVWKTGCIGVKLTEPGEYNKLLSTSGAAPWKAGSMTMSHWVLVPESYHGKKAELGGWLKKAHAVALTAPKKEINGKPAAAKRKKNR